MLETLRGRLDDLRISSRMCHTLVQARTARLIGGSTSDEFGRPSCDYRRCTSLGGLEHVRVLQTNLCCVIGVTERHRYADTRRRLFDLRRGMEHPRRDGEHMGWCMVRHHVLRR